MHRSIPARALTLVSLTVVSLTLALSGAPSSAAERLIVNAKVYTASATRPYAEAVAIRDSTIVAVGSRATRYPTDIAACLSGGCEWSG